MKERIQLNHDAVKMRKHLGMDANTAIDIFTVLGAQPDLTVVFYPMRASISGMCIKDDFVRLIAINSRLSRGRQRFTAAHELCHLYYHPDFRTMICAKDLSSQQQDYEKEADQFASFFLAPYDALLGFIDHTLNKLYQSLSESDIIHIEQYFGMSRQATLVRLQLEKLLTEDEANRMKNGIIRTAQKLGLPDDLYRPCSENQQYLTIGSYVKLANELFAADKISSGKYEELLLDAFRDDLVYGSDSVEEYYD